MKKSFVNPEMRIGHVELSSIIATSGEGAGGTIPDAPFQSRQSIWTRFDNED